MSAIVVTAALAPLMKEPTPRGELVSQLVSGETGTVLEEGQGWFRISRDVDRYPGWIHQGYLRRDDDALSGWTAGPWFLAEGAELEDTSGYRVRLPLLARVAAAGDEWALASGWRGRLVGGSIHPADALYRSARSVPTIEWSCARFSGTPYLWGGTTPWGVDCSGLIQTTFAARGVALPRDSHEQAQLGSPVPPESIQPCDLLFFSESGARITHVAFAGADDTLVHSTLACGGFTIEPWGPGTRASRLRDQLVAVRRIQH